MGSSSLLRLSWHEPSHNIIQPHLVISKSGDLRPCSKLMFKYTLSKSLVSWNTSLIYFQPKFRLQHQHIAECSKAGKILTVRGKASKRGLCHIWQDNRWRRDTSPQHASYRQLIINSPARIWLLIRKVQRGKPSHSFIYNHRPFLTDRTPYPLRLHNKHRATCLPTLIYMLTRLNAMASITIHILQFRILKTSQLYSQHW